MVAMDFVLRAVVTDLESGYVVSVSRLSDDGEVEILGEEEVGSIVAAHQFLERIATDCSFPADRVERLYNIKGRITNKPPKGRT